ncbi:MAG: hypothetical protein KBT27_04890 [Prevotellaceae bacterium]|nr:hypothetical protein [Candidatus Faecinaster equi]
MEFSIKNLHELDNTAKTKFYQNLVNQLQGIRVQIGNDDVLNGYSQYLSNPLQDDTIVDNLYSAITAGIQAGSGNQTLYLEVLKIITESWKTIQ